MSTVSNRQRDGKNGELATVAPEPSLWSKRLGLMVSEARGRLGWTLLRAASEIDISYAYLRRIEAGTVNVSVDVLQRIVEALRLDFGFGPAAGSLAPNHLMAEVRRDISAILERIDTSTYGKKEDSNTGGVLITFSSSAIPHTPHLAPAVLPAGPEGDGPLEEVNGPLTRRRKARVEGEVSVGEPMHATSEDDIVMIPEAAVDRGEKVFRVRGNSLDPWGFVDGDLLFVDLRTDGNVYTSELVLAQCDDGRVVVGRFWSKHGQRRLFSEEGNLVLVEGTPFTVTGVINSFYRATSTARRGER